MSRIKPESPFPLGVGPEDDIHQDDVASAEVFEDGRLSIVLTDGGGAELDSRKEIRQFLRWYQGDVGGTSPPKPPPPHQGSPAGGSDAYGGKWKSSYGTPDDFKSSYE